MNIKIQDLTKVYPDGHKALNGLNLNIEPGMFGLLGPNGAGKTTLIKKLIAELKKTNPFVEGNIFKSVENVNLETVVAYKKDGVKHHFLDDYDTKASISQK